MFTWSISDALDDARAVVRYALSLTLAPVLDMVYPPDERWDWPQDGSDLLVEREESEEVFGDQTEKADRLDAEMWRAHIGQEPSPDPVTTVTVSGLPADVATLFELKGDGNDWSLKVAAISAALCDKCGTELGESCAVSDLVPGRFCSDRCRKVTEIGQLIKESKSSAAAAVADDGLGGMSDAEPPPGPAGQGVSFPPTFPAQHLDLAEWLTPAIQEIIPNHTHKTGMFGQSWCAASDGSVCEGNWDDEEGWHDHVAFLIASRVVAALPDYRPMPETGLDMGARLDGACDLFPQHTRKDA